MRNEQLQPAGRQLRGPRQAGRREAVLLAAWVSDLLGLAASEPCLLVHRRTWSGEQAVTSVRLPCPGTRYRLYGRQKASP
jgi:GntR family histidine utilization transcriptional repressor